MSSQIWIFFFLTLFIHLINSELIELISIWRHGDRAPSSLPYTNDLNGLESWPRGWDQLTNEGIGQTYELGTFLRSRYIEDLKLFGPSFDRSEIFIQSSDSERALESAQSVSAGLFPPIGNLLWNSSFVWQPIPIHSNGIDREDPLLKPTGYTCPNYENMKNSDHEELAKQFDHEYGDLFQYLSEMTGDTINGLTADGLNDIQREIIHNLPQPQWVTNTYNNLSIMPIIDEIKRQMRLNEFNTQEKAKLVGGYLLNNILTYMEELRDGQKTPKAVLYSSHDGSLLALLSVLNMSNDQLIPYAATILFEISRSDDKQLTVQILYRNSTNQPPVPLDIPNCQSPCSLSKFLELYESQRIRTRDQLDKLCNEKTTKAAIKEFPNLFLFIGSIIFFFMK